MGNPLMKVAAKAAGIELPEDLDLASVLGNIEDMRNELVNAVTGIDSLKILMQVLVLIEASRAAHDGVHLDAEIRDLINEIVIET